MKNITVVVTTFRRLENARIILGTLRNQRTKPVLFLWDNAGKDWDCGPVDWRIRSSPNSNCFGRWWMLSQAETDYIMSIDDDLCPTGSRILEKIIGFLETSSHSHIGPEGVILKKEGQKRYSQGKQYFSGRTEATTQVDIIKGRLMAMTPTNLKMSRLGEWSTPAEDGLLVNTFYTSKIIPALFFRGVKKIAGGGGGAL